MSIPSGAGHNAPVTRGEIGRMAAIGAALTAILTYPTLPGLATHGRFDTGDGRFSIWNVGWIDHALVTSPSQVFNANIFYPHESTLTYSEPNLVAGLLGLPAFALTGNAVAALNTAVLVGLFLAFAAMWLLVRRVTGSEAGALISAAGFAFCPFVQAHTAHIQLMLVFGFPLVMAAFVACRERPSLLRGAALGAALAVTAQSSGYYGIFAALMLGVAVAAWPSPDRRYWAALVSGAVTCLATVLPVLVPYRAAREAIGGGGMSLDQARAYSADAVSYLSSPAHAHQWLPAAADSVFPGFVMLALALVGVALAWSAGARDRRMVAMFVAIAALAAWASFGPAGGLYGWLATVVPFMDMLRAPVRLGVVVTFALAVLAGFGARRVLDGRPWLTAVVLLAVGLELAAVPWPLRPGPEVPPAYRLLASLPRGPVVEFPFPYRRADFHEHTRYMVGSIHHWQPLVNGYSDLTPPEFEDLALRINAFPDPDSFELMRATGVRYVTWHLDRYNEAARERVLARLPAYQAYLRPLVNEGDVRLMEIVTWPEPSAAGSAR